MLGRAVATGFLLLAALAPAAAQSPDGETLFRPCAACHMIGEGAVHRVGPVLNGLIGRPIGSQPGYAFSEDLATAGAEGEYWTEETLDRFLTDPSRYFPGTSMVFRGIRDDAHRATLIAWLIEEGGPATPDMAAADVAIAPEIAAILEIEGDAPYGAFLSSECTACHVQGGSDGDNIPSVSGLAPSVFIAGLVAYRDGTREHQVMNMVAGRLGDEEIAALAAYFENAE